MNSVDFAAKTAHIDEAETTANRSESYDYLVVGSGLRRSFPTVPQSLLRADFITEARDHAEEIKKAREGVVVVGGG